MSSPIHKVALAGASGKLGKPVLHALVAAGFDVTVLTRETSTSTFPSGVKVIKVDYDSVSSLTAALQGQDALVSTVTTPAVFAQEKQIDAAIAAGVKRFIPSEFGADEIMKQKLVGTGTTWTAVYCNAFLDWGIDFEFYIDLEVKKINMYDGGDFKVTTTPTDFVARGVVAILKNPDETSNREVRIQGTTVSQKELLVMAKKVVGKEGWNVQEVSTAEEHRKAMVNFQKDPSDLWAWIRGILVRSQFGEGYSRSFQGKEDNEVLGLTELNKEDLEAYLTRWKQTGSSAVKY